MSYLSSHTTSHPITPVYMPSDTSDSPRLLSCVSISSIFSKKYIFPHSFTLLVPFDAHIQHKYHKISRCYHQVPYLFAFQNPSFTLFLLLIGNLLSCFWYLLGIETNIGIGYDATTMSEIYQQGWISNFISGRDQLTDYEGQFLVKIIWSRLLLNLKRLFHWK